jgi:hypothetical protein
MAYGAGMVAALKAGALILDPRDFAIGCIAVPWPAFPPLTQPLQTFRRWLTIPSVPLGDSLWRA